MVDWQDKAELVERLAQACRSAADNAPRGGIYHQDAAKLLAMLEVLDAYWEEKQAAAEAAPPDQGEEGTGTAEAAALAASAAGASADAAEETEAGPEPEPESEPESEPPASRRPKGRRR
jgi:hypothetical protein